MDKSIAKYLDLKYAMQLAAKEVLRLQLEGMAMEVKGPLDVVTSADRAAEEIMDVWVDMRFPDDGIVAEEGTRRPSPSGFYWYIDPVDGTKNLASGLPFFGISAGRAKDGRGVFGWLCFPAFQKHLYAIQGGGVWTDSFNGAGPQPFERKEFDRSFAESVVAVGLTAGNRHLFDAFNKRCWNTVVIGSFVYETMLVIEGHYSAYVHTGATQFDAAAAVAIAEELGLQVSDLHGKPVDLREHKIPVVIAQNKRILDEILEICESNKIG